MVLSELAINDSPRVYGLKIPLTLSQFAALQRESPSRFRANLAKRRTSPSCTPASELNGPVRRFQPCPYNSNSCIMAAYSCCPQHFFRNAELWPLQRCLAL